MTTTIIRPEGPGEHTAIAEVNRLVFGSDAEARLVAALRKADCFDSSLSLVAVHDGLVVGHILFSPIRIETDDGNVPAMALAPMAVLPACQRHGIGSALVWQGLQACRRAVHSIVVVLGHADYYPRFGFRPSQPTRVARPIRCAGRGFYGHGAGARRTGRHQWSSSLPSGVRRSVAAGRADRSRRAVRDLPRLPCARPTTVNKAWGPHDLKGPVLQGR